MVVVPLDCAPGNFIAVRNSNVQTKGTQEIFSTHAEN